jgi:hypothetical protein
MSWIHISGCAVFHSHVLDMMEQNLSIARRNHMFESPTQSTHALFHMQNGMHAQKWSQNSAFYHA